MKYAGMPMGMWALFAGSFRRELTAVFGYDAAAAKEITKNAKPRYRKIIAGLPEFEKADRFKMNIVNCAMLCAFVLSMPQRPDVQRLTDYYAKSMITAPMRWFCRKSGKTSSPKRILPPCVRPQPYALPTATPIRGTWNCLNIRTAAAMRRALTAAASVR